MNVHELLERLEQGETMKAIAEEQGTNPKTYQRKLKRLGYAYDRDSRKWSYAGEGEAPNADLTANPNTKPVTVTPTVHPKTSEKADTKPLTPDEIKQLRTLLNTAPKVVQPLTNNATLHDRIKTLQKGERTRKTIIIRQDISEQLDKFTEQEKVYKSDVLELAIMDFLEKYNR